MFARLFPAFSPRSALSPSNPTISDGFKRASLVVLALACLALLVAASAPAEASLLKKLVGSNAANRIDGNRLSNVIDLKAGNDRGRGGGGNDRISGGKGSDRLFGGTGKDRLFGGPGKDLLYGQNGNDRLSGGAGNDRVYGSAGHDNLYGSAGSDLLDGGAGNDRLSGGAGNDKLFGAGGADRMYGGAGNDRLEANQGKDVASGGAGNDLIAGGDDGDTLRGDAGNDLISGGAGADRINGGAGDDLIDAADGAPDTKIDGGPGRDTCFVDAADRPKVVNCENVRTTTPGGSIAPGGDINAFRLTAATGTTCVIAQTCEFSLLGSGARGESLSVSIGEAPFVSGSGSGGVVAGGAWYAAGTYSCTGDGKITVSAGGQGVEVPVTCKPVGVNSNGKLRITSPTSITCTIGVPCDYTLEGTGADGAVAVAGIPGVTAVPGGLSQVNPDGTWSASGTITCVAGGRIAASDVFDTDTIPVNCQAPGNLTGGNLGITSPSALSCTVGQICTYNLSGTGGDGSSIAVVGIPGVAIVPGSQSSSVASGGSWTATGQYTCTVAGHLAANDLVDITDVETVPVNCSLL